MSVVERSALGVLLAATLATLLLVARNGLTPAQQPWTFGLLFWGWTALLYSAVGLAAVLLGLLAARYPPLRPLYRWLPAGAAVFVGAALLSNPRAVSSLFALEGPDRFRLLVPAAATLAALAAVVLAIPLARGRILIRTAALLALAGSLVALWPEGEARGARGRAAAPIRLQSAPFALVGVDGADWTYMAPLMARGELPHFKAMMERGAWGPLETLRPTLSPAIWTTIATGRRPRRHGVLGFTARRLRGVEQTLPDLRTLSRLGFPFLLARLEAGGQILEAPISSFTRRVPAFWNIATAQGSPVSVINWWGTWPAEPVLGEIVSERAYYHELLYRGQARRPDGLTSPEDLYAEIARRIVLPDEVTVADTRAFMDVTAEEFERMRVKHPSPLEGIAYEFTYFHSMFTTNRRLALDAIERSRRRYGRPADLFVLFRLVDKTSHTALVYSELVQDHEDASSDDIRRYRGVVSAAYRAVDDALGEIQQAFGEANVIVVSDHGFKLERGRGYNHTRAPAGVFLAAGPAFPPGRVEGLSVLDIMPLMLYLKGFPIAQDFDGRLPTEALRPALLASNPPRVIASYGRRGWPVKNAEGSAEIDAEMLERLRALGYLK
jgi:Type I phosphodiesterase / nucleotide pyrophosphatase